MSRDSRIPFTILTGWLGAGKTTTLNRVLAAPHQRRVAVLVNELGRVSIDSELILSKGDDILELAGGCLCCKVDVKNDLWDGIVDVIERSEPEHVVLETTGIAEPQVIVEGLEKLRESPSEVARRVVSAGVVCVVDVAAGIEQLDAREEARLQVASADRLLLNKLDLAGPDLEAVHQRLIELNDTAERASFPAGSVGDHQLVEWLLAERPLRAQPQHAHHHRDGQIIAACVEESGWFSRGAVEDLLNQQRSALLRAKGFVAVHGESRRAIVDLAGGRVTLRWGEEWSDDDRPRTQLVFIGEGIDEMALRRRLWACRVAS